MCTGIFAKSAGLVSKVDPGNKMIMQKVIPKVTPPFVKQLTDKITPDAERKEAIKNGMGKNFSNPNSEADQELNEQNAATLKQQQADAFAAQYNNQARFV